jgi:hypothetical protein
MTSWKPGGHQNLVDIVLRRTTLAFQAFWRGLMPLAVLASPGAVWFAFRNRWLYRSVPNPMWRAALLGGLVAGIVGAFAEDSGPLLFVVAVGTLALATAYVQGEPLRFNPAVPRAFSGTRATSGRSD